MSERKKEKYMTAKNVDTSRGKNILQCIAWYDFNKYLMDQSLISREKVYEGCYIPVRFVT